MPPSMQETVTLVLDRAGGGERESIEIPRRVGSVKIGELIGEGAGGIVLGGFDETLNRRVAVKILHRYHGALNAAAAAEIVSGLRSAARIKHANIVTVHTVDQISGMPVIVMELIDGVSLRELRTRLPNVDVPLALHMLRGVVDAIAVMHDANVVHRDLKPANILFDRDGRPHVCDFGLAVEVDALKSRHSGGEAVAGSPLYMSPEMYDGHVSPQSDVYALGVMLFELLCGAPPFNADSMSSMRECHQAGEPPYERLAEHAVSDDVLDLLRRCLNKQRFLRFKTGAHLLRAIELLAPTGPRDEMLRLKLAAAVAGARPDTPTQAPADAGAIAMTTFDLVRERAKRKREQS